MAEWRVIITAIQPTFSQGLAGDFVIMTSEMPEFRVRFWGVRGSYPTPGPQTIRYGGNTTCVEVEAGGQILVLDAGSGIIRLGDELLRRAAGQKLHVTLLLTHGHSDHL